jgi:hypothetical protein
MTLLGRVGGYNPLLAKSVKEERIVVTFGATCGENGICQNLVEARVVPMSNYWGIFTTDGHGVEVASGELCLGPLYQVFVDEVDTDGNWKIG